MVRVHLGLPYKVKERAEVQSRTERPRAFVERAEYPKGTKTVKCKGRRVQEKAEAAVRHKHRHKVHLNTTASPELTLQNGENYKPYFMGV